jgi:hypothetical protein
MGISWHEFYKKSQNPPPTIEDIVRTYDTAIKNHPEHAAAFERVKINAIRNYNLKKILG